MARNIVTIAVLCILAAIPAAHAQEANHDRRYFREIAAHHFAVPPGASAFVLAQELTPWLASPDPALRDELAYTILDIWIRHGMLTEQQLLALLPPLQQNLTSGIGESGNDSVFQRSFSALTLASFAQGDLQQPFLSSAQYRSLLAAALNYLRDERDNRGFEPVKGWIHSAAHTADLLAALASDPRFTPADQQALFAAVENRLRSTTGIYSYGEQDRLAVTLLVVIMRDDFQLAGFQNWLGTVQQDNIVWQTSPPDPAQLALFENHTYLLEAMLARMPIQTPLSPAATQARDAAREALRNR
ncbi:MAG TPA: DUF2785 domain-containing protein [Acidobacteriaceae bacterium]|nr:DUF2785 domain-containing protein [Acidobacteriaceae bacterium]